MSESKPKPAGPVEPGLEAKPAKDLEPPQPESETVRGGFAAPGKRFSDLTLKRDVASLTDALSRLRALRF
jgi:hypothetical protein